MSDSNIILSGDYVEDIKTIITCTLKINPFVLDESTQLIEGDLSLSSLQLIELVVAIEKEFNISMDDELMVIENFSSVKTLADTVDKILQ